MSFSHVLSPFRLGNVELGNRVVRTAHGTGLGRSGLSDELIAWHEARARGGVALTVLEATGVHPSGPLPLNAWDEAIVPRYAELARRVHAHGMKVFSQLNHLGLEEGARGQRPWSTAALVSPHSGLRAIAMSEAQIAEVTAGFAAAARRAREGGLDGVEVHCAHGHLLQQFLSPLQNPRTDGYGGTPAGRARFLREVLAAVRAAVGADFVLGIRIGPQRLPGGFGVEDCRQLVGELDRDRLVDYVSLSSGTMYTPERIIGGMHEPTGYELGDSARIAAATRLPTIVAGRIRTLAQAEDVLASGIADLVGMTRAHIADPELVARTVAGRAAEVRPCIACNQGCVGGLARGRIGCTVNPAAGRELELDERRLGRASTPRRVVVVGGGPAGLEAARIAALRGHRVTLLEAAPRPGGALEAARRAPHHAAIGDIADWLVREVTRLGVELRCGVRADAATVAALAPEAIVLATGAAPVAGAPQRFRPGAAVPGEFASHVITARALLSGAAPGVAPRHAAVLDELGTDEAIGAAEWLVERGVAVTFVTGLRSFAPKLDAALVTRPALERLRRGRFDLVTRAALVEIAPDACTLAWLDGGGPWRVPADLVVTALPGLPADELAMGLAGIGCPLAVVGDARHPDTLEAAIRDAHLAARRLA